MQPPRVERWQSLEDRAADGPRLGDNPRKVHETVVSVRAARRRHSVAVREGRLRGEVGALAVDRAVTAVHAWVKVLMGDATGGGLARSAVEDPALDGT